MSVGLPEKPPPRSRPRERCWQEGCRWKLTISKHVRCYNHHACHQLRSRAQFQCIQVRHASGEQPAEQLTSTKDHVLRVRHACCSKCTSIQLHAGYCSFNAASRPWDRAASEHESTRQPKKIASNGEKLRPTAGLLLFVHPVAELHGRTFLARSAKSSERRLRMRDSKLSFLLLSRVWLCPRPVQMHWAMPQPRGAHTHPVTMQHARPKQNDSALLESCWHIGEVKPSHCHEAYALRALRGVCNKYTCSH